MDHTLNELRRALADRYEVEQELGRGGMAIVYLARDRRHERRVAIKVLRPDLGGASAADRFLREIRTAAQLHHPHILALFDSGVAGEHRFYVMPYVEGESLRQRLERTGALPVDEAVRLAREVADALAYAHAVGVVHRDIKPENILLSAGHALVADFGIARAADLAGLTLTEAGVAIGTPAYMSPEQAMADPKLDGRADQYALGCVLYEMLAGQPPFSGPTSQAIMARHATDAVPPLATVRQVPTVLDAVVARALAKVPADRWPDARAFATALEEALPLRTAELPAPARAPSRRLRLGAVTALFAITVVGALLLPRWLGGPVADLSAEEVPSVAILPFQFTGDPADSAVADGIHELLVQGLARVGGIQMPGSARMARYRDQLVDPQAVGRELGVATVLTGRVHVADGRIRVSPELVRVVDGTVQWSQRFDGDLVRGDTIVDLFDIQDALAAQVIAQLAPRFSGVRIAAAPARIPTRDAEAWSLYLQARRAGWNLTLPSLDHSLGLLRRALARDSLFAEAWAAFHMTAGFLTGEGGALSASDKALADSALARAYALDSTNAIVLGERGWVLAERGEWREGRRSLSRAVELAPGSFDAALNYSGFIRFLGELDTAMVYGMRARDIDPTNAVAWNSVASFWRDRGMLDSAMVVVRQAVRLDSTLWYAHRLQAELFHFLGERDSARVSIDRAIALGALPSHVFLHYVKIGDRARAQEALARVRAAPASVRESPLVLAAFDHLADGNIPAALEAFHRAVGHVRTLSIALPLHELSGYLGSSPRLEDLRARLYRGADRVP